ncbi:hypothetical protein U9M48_022876 [Paspalum notatum var. saurae]|uniref:Uncharacterized protein n=1 Tax=Paspalum notatum var. saurae TaxID=547442 RepID=A0AAQ3TMT4_PASNO
MEVVGGVSLRPSPAPARIRRPMSSVDVVDVVGGRSILRAAPRRQQPAPARRALVVEARGGRSWSERQMQQQRRMPQLPKIEDDGNPRFVIFIRTANVRAYSLLASIRLALLLLLASLVCGALDQAKARASRCMQVYFWYPLNIITGGTTAKIMLAAKDNFLGKYIYKDTLARNLAAVIYKDEDEIIDTAKEQYRVLKTENEFRYGYKVVENGNIRSALTTSNVIELPKKDELKTVVDKVKDFFGDVTSGAKESFAQITGSAVSKAEEEAEGKEQKFRSKRRKKRKSKEGLSKRFTNTEHYLFVDREVTLPLSTSGVAN